MVGKRVFDSLEEAGSARLGRVPGPVWALCSRARGGEEKTVAGGMDLNTDVGYLPAIRHILPKARRDWRLVLAVPPHRTAFTVPHRTEPYRTVLNRTASYRAVPDCTAPYHTVPHRTVLSRIASYRAVPYRTVPHFTAPYHSHRSVPYRVRSGRVK